jgi:hypothetical protein
VPLPAVTCALTCEVGINDEASSGKLLGGPASVLNFCYGLKTTLST